MIHNDNILVVDDEEDIREILKFNLELDGYNVDTAASAEEALRLIGGRGDDGYQLVLLDVMMDGMSGFDMAKSLKKNPQTQQMPIIFLTAKDSENDIVRGLNIGADDYVSKPFSVRELVARIRAVIRRSAGEAREAEHRRELSYGDLKLDTALMTVTLKGREVAMTKTEYELLRLLLSEPGKVFSRQQLIDRVWPKDVLVLDRTVDVYVTRLRKKIGPYAGNIVTRHGFGYFFEE